jgi:hypothetical protein
MVSGIKASDPWSVSVKNGLIEVVTLHTRILQQFLFRDIADRDDDALGIHFFEHPDNWKRIRPEPGEHLSALGKRVGKEIAHLTYTRMNVSPDKKGWNFLATSFELLKVLDLFANSASTQLLSPKVKEAIKHWKEFTGFNNAALPEKL